MRTLLRLETIPAIRFESCVIFPYGPIGWNHLFRQIIQVSLSCLGNVNDIYLEQRSQETLDQVADRRSLTRRLKFVLF